VNLLRLAYLALGGGLAVFGAIFVWQGLRRHAGPSTWPVRIALALGLAVAIGGVVAAVLLEARAAYPF
jgi:hypothetical protein